jgi:hypothetical protein
VDHCRALTRQMSDVRGQRSEGKSKSKRKF